MIRKSVIRTISMILILLGSSTCVAIAGSIDTNSPELLDIKLSTNEISAPGEIEVEVIDNGETIFLGTKTELFELLRKNKEEEIFDNQFKK